MAFWFLLLCACFLVIHYGNVDRIIYNKYFRFIFAMITVLIGIQYLYWRIHSAMPHYDSWIAQGWVYFFVFFEFTAMCSGFLGVVVLSRTINRSEQADRGLLSPLQHAPTDVFIATYNESYDILERSIISASSIIHPDLRVWVLDDGNREWVKKLAEENGAHYTFRIKGKHAKAGNVNNGVKIARSTGRKPDFILLLDADFTVKNNILQRVLPIFEEEDIGIVQTPQHFFNPDPIQINLLCHTSWPDEQRVFFNSILESKDAWNAAFCCGTSAVFRADALEKCGGLATATVTEDMLTSFLMYEHGYRTVLLNEQLSMGLAPEGLAEYITQRCRWCLGAIQQIYTRWNSFGPAKIGWANRISMADGVIVWAVIYPFKMLTLLAPGVFWWTGVTVIDCPIEKLWTNLGPYAVLNIVFNYIYTKRGNVPILSDVAGIVSAPSVIISVMTGLIKPWGHPFKVTDKGVARDGITIHWGFMRPFVLILVLIVTGMMRHLSAYDPLQSSAGYDSAIVWSFLNIFLLVAVCVVCIELPKRRRDERFPMGEEAILDNQGKIEKVTLMDLSLRGALLHFPGRFDEKYISESILSIDNNEIITPIKINRIVDENTCAVEFAEDKEIRKKIIIKMFTGRYNAEVDIKNISTLKSWIKRIFE
ncbi:glycosyltransferase [Komagataeibacter sp. FXV3]|nr:glycosyltransferase [Komagataeibacter sp. FXV3]